MNRLLEALDPACRKRLTAYMQVMDLKLSHMVCDAGSRLEHAYFPMGAVLSTLTVLEDGSAIEAANIGSEGAFGIFTAMYSRYSFTRSIVQLEGAMARIPIAVLHKEFENSSYVRHLFVSYAETAIAQVQQTVACNAMHTTEERICRWLLMMDDRANGRALPYTHEFLSGMLGANRKSVTLAAQSLQASGLIAYRRGNIRITNRKGLEKASCECYAIVRQRFDAFSASAKPQTDNPSKGRSPRS